MATTFERVGTSVLVTIGGSVYSLPSRSALFPCPRRDAFIVISDEYNVQRESEGLSINTADVTGVAFASRNELIRQLATLFFFDQASSSDFGGQLIRLTNRTGAPSVKGMVVTASPAYDSAVGVCPADSLKPIGVVYESGVANGAECYIVVSGLADVLLQDNTSATRGYWVKVSDTQDGRANASNISPSGGTIAALEDHGSEIGHCLQSVTAGTNKLARCVIHFN